MRRLSRFARSTGVVIAAGVTLLVIPLSQAASAAPALGTVTGTGMSGLQNTGTQTTIPNPTNAGLFDAGHAAITGFTPSTPIFGEQCQYPGGTGPLPTDTTNCESLGTVLTSTDGNGAGTVSFKAFLGPNGTSAPETCDQSDYCVIWFGEDTSNLTGSNHVWTAAFVFSQPTQAPEAPYAIALPTAALIIGGGAFFVYFRRRRHNADSIV